MLDFLESFMPAPPAATAEVLSSSALGWRPFPVCHCHHCLPCQMSAVPSLWHRCWAARVVRANIFPVVFLARRDFTFSSSVLLAHGLLQIHAQISVMETWGNCTGSHASAALTADPNCRSGEGSIWFVSWLFLKPLGLTSVEASTVTGITTSSYLRSRQVEEHLHCEKLGYLIMVLCWTPWP